MEELRQFFLVIGSAIVLISSVVGFIVQNIALIKQKKYTKLTNFVKKSVVEAESFFEMSGKEKKEYVISKVDEFTNNNKINSNHEEIELIIEDFIDLSKKINNKNDISQLSETNEETEIKSDD